MTLRHEPAVALACFTGDIVTDDCPGLRNITPGSEPEFWKLIRGHCQKSGSDPGLCCVMLVCGQAFLKIVVAISKASAARLT
jgi:hypothetical protein